MPARVIRDVRHDELSRRHFLTAVAALGVRPVGIFSSAPMDQNPILEGLEGMDLAGIESVGEINVEKLAALAPDLVVTPFDPGQDGPPSGFVEGPVQGQVEELAPTVRIDGIKDPVDVTMRFEQLGADLQAPTFVAARKRLEDAGAALSRRSPACSPSPSMPHPARASLFCRPAAFPALRQLQQLGPELVVPEGGTEDINEDFTSFFFDSISLELANKYPAGLILLDADTSPENMAGIPTWAALPAVQAGQLV